MPSWGKGVLTPCGGLAFCYSQLHLLSEQYHDAYKMVEDTESCGLIKLGLTTLVEPSSGNTKIALVFVGIHKGYKAVDYSSLAK